MGYNTATSSITLTARLTPYGRTRMVSTNNNLITSFSLGDSDANYFVTPILTTGQVPAEAGDIGPNGSNSNSTTQNANLKSVLIVSGGGVLTKLVEPQSSTVSSEILSNGQITISGTNIVHNVINRNDNSTDSLVNLYYSFGFPLNATQDTVYTGKTFANGGYSDTSLSAFSTTKIVALAINNTKFGELIDGKQLRVVLPTTGGTYTMYSTFQNKGASLTTEDANYRDTSPVTAGIDSNIAFLFSDGILTPNGGNPSLSWSTGFGNAKPFSLGQKSLWNLQTNSNLAVTADTFVGIAYLDKGFVVLTHPTIVADYGDVNPTGVTTGVTATYDSVSTNVFQSITCIAARGEFGGSTNPTFSGSDVPRVSEIGLYDSSNNLIAIAKTDRHILKNINEFKVFGVKITL
jgi:hypothetical protein